MSPAHTEMHGLLGEALDANRRGRLSHFITGPDSVAVTLFDPAHRDRNEEGDWYGEHAGKWLIAAAKAAARSGDDVLAASVVAVADHLVSVQESDGYLGNYAPHRRFMVPQSPKPESWNGEPALRTWDVWTHSYLLLGLIEVHRCFGHARHLDAARRIGDLCWRTFCERGLDITSVGNHHGMSATVLMDPAVELHFATGEQRYLDLALKVLEQAERNPRLALLSHALIGVDASEIATGKAYQLLWNMVGVAKLHRATGNPDHLRAAENIWRNVRDHHLGLGGGPWGGAGLRSREIFNPPHVFDPRGYVETCSVLAWIQLNRELLLITGNAQYAEEIERTAYNDLLGAQAPDGEDWCYYSFGNGRRVHTTYWRCCKSSGAMALEELPALACTTTNDGGIAVNLYGPGRARLHVEGAGEVRLEQRTRYPFDGRVILRVEASQSARFPLQLRIPASAEGAAIAVNGVALAHAPVAGSHACIERQWQPGDEVTLDFPMPPQVHRRVSRNVQESRAPDGSQVAQQVLHYEYAGLTRGPLAYATGLIDGFKTEETLRLPDTPPAQWLEILPEAPDGEGPTIRMHLGYRAALDFEPYYRAGGRRDGTWRLSWMPLAPAE
ncbi:MAG: glycoside hydrolase family 127 protein [Pseudoxanthomonas sp.]